MLLVLTSVVIGENVINLVSVSVLTDIQVVIAQKDFVLLVQLGRTWPQESMRLMVKWNAPTEESVIESQGNVYAWMVSLVQLARD